MNRGEIEDAKVGIQELIDALARAEKRALRSQLIRLMMHIIKWNTQPERRSYSWRGSIYNARHEIAEIQEETPSLNLAVVNEMWDRCFLQAKRDAEGEMGVKSLVKNLTVAQVFDDDYDLNDQDAES